MISHLLSSFLFIYCMEIMFSFVMFAEISNEILVSSNSSKNETKLRIYRTLIDAQIVFLLITLIMTLPF